MTGLRTGVERVNEILEQDVFRLAAEKSAEIRRKNKDKDKQDTESFVFEEDFFDVGNGTNEMICLQWLARILAISGNDFIEFNAMMDTDIVELYTYYSVRMALYVMD